MNTCSNSTSNMHDVLDLVIYINEKVQNDIAFFWAKDFEELLPTDGACLLSFAFRH